MEFKFKTYRKAIRVLRCIRSIIDEYGVITLLDIKDIADYHNGCYKDNVIGWCDKNDFYLIGNTIYTRREPMPIIEESERTDNKPEDPVVAYCKADVEHILAFYKSMKDYEEIKQHEQHAIRDIQHAIDELIRAGYSYGDSIIESLRDVLTVIK